ncbi:MFS transporter [Alloscardovia theropitheci]|uniref:MFS transporter n=1 Tax=Alloscardovia theropitheci TaxID=2496842 RepID=A0A4V2MU46_9BIFI|nr:MFS transporter [Alloscardovia theropitheci]TCD54919.1 MFS transporter [Alloscardovia theropitheci]
MQLFKIFRGYWRLAISDFFSVYATSVAETTIQLWLLNSLLVGFADSSRYLTVYLTLCSISALITGLFFGALAERFGVLKTIMGACATRMVAGLCIIGTIYATNNSLIASHNVAFWVLTVLVLITTGSDTFYSPALTSFINKVTDAEKLIDVLSLMRLISLLGTLVGPAIAGFASSKNAYISILFTETISLIITIVLILIVSKNSSAVSLTDTDDKATTADTPQSTKNAFTEFFADWFAGLKIFAKTSTYRLLFPFAIFEAIASSGIGFAVILFFSNVLHDTQSYGWCLSAMSLGYAISYALAPRLAEKMSFWAMLTLSYILIIFSLIGMALSPNGLIAILFGFCFSFSQAIISPSFQAILVRAVDESLVSQVISVFVSVVAAIGAVSYALWEFIYSLPVFPHLTHESIVILGTAIIYVVMLILAVTIKKMRSLKVS